MTHEIRIERVTSRLLAVTRGRATLADLGSKIIALSAPVWEFIKRRNIATGGHNVVIYRDEGDRALLLTPGGVPIEVGADVLAPFTSEAEVTMSATPDGTVATTRHIGPYHLLPQAHAAVRGWCRQNAHAIVGTNWEIYGHWTDDPAKLETDVFYLLQ